MHTYIQLVSAMVVQYRNRVQSPVAQILYTMNRHVTCTTWQHLYRSTANVPHNCMSSYLRIYELRTFTKQNVEQKTINILQYQYSSTSSCLHTVLEAYATGVLRVCTSTVQLHLYLVQLSPTMIHAYVILYQSIDQNTQSIAWISVLSRISQAIHTRQRCVAGPSSKRIPV